MTISDFTKRCKKIRILKKSYKNKVIVELCTGHSMKNVVSVSLYCRVRISTVGISFSMGLSIVLVSVTTASFPGCVLGGM